MLELLSTFLQATFVVTLPYVVSHGSEVLVHHVAHREFGEVPIVTTLARVQGLLTGGLLLYMNLDGRYYDLQALFLPESPWNLTLSQFLLERSNLFTYDIMPVVRLLTDVPTISGALAATALVVLPLLLALLCLRFWRGWETLRAFLACIGIAVWSAWMTVYLLCMVFWSLHLLNFWALAIATLYIQRRHAGGHH